MRYLQVIVILCLVACHSKDSVMSPSQLKSVTTMNMNSNTGSFFIVSKDIYTYSADGKLSMQQQFTYDNQNSVFVPYATLNFSFQGGNLSSIAQAIMDTNQKRTIQYSYTNNQLTKILLDDAEGTEATIQYLAGDTIQAIYRQSNGTFFVYKFLQKNKDVYYEQTLDESNHVTSEITHEYDDTINPYSLLGYTDMFFSNQSYHNKTKTSSTYIGSFPTLVPVSYEYLYNDQKLPTQQITTFKTYPSLDRTTQSKMIFEYY